MNVTMTKALSNQEPDRTMSETMTRTKAENDIGDSKAVTNRGDSHQDGHRASVRTKAETNMGDTHRDGHRAGARTKTETDISDSKAVTNLGDSHQDGQRPTT